MEISSANRAAGLLRLFDAVFAKQMATPQDAWIKRNQQANGANEVRHIFTVQWLSHPNGSFSFDRWQIMIPLGFFLNAFEDRIVSVLRKSKEVPQNWIFRSESCTTQLIYISSLLSSCKASFFIGWNIVILHREHSSRNHFVNRRKADLLKLCY